MDKQIHLMPEVCFMTGLTDGMRADFRIMKDLAEYTRQTPAVKREGLLKFRQALEDRPEAKELLSQYVLALFLTITTMFFLHHSI